MPPDHLIAQLRGKRVFLTGGTGLFGKWLLNALRGVDVELVSLSRNPAAFMKSFSMDTDLNLSFVKGDVRDFEFPAGRFDYVIHAATPVVADDADDDELRSIITEGTERVLEFAAASGVGRLLYVSSGAVYGPQPCDLDRVAENHPLAPVTAYGKGKRAAEQLCLESGLDVVIARCFAFVGPDMPRDAHFAIANFIGNCLRNEPIVIRGDGTPLRSYLHADDLSEWLAAVLVDGAAGEAYNVGSDDAISIAELARLVRDALDARVEIRVLGQSDPSRPVERYVPSVNKIRSDLGVHQTIALQEAIRRSAGGARA